MGLDFTLYLGKGWGPEGGDHTIEVKHGLPGGRSQLWDTEERTLQTGELAAKVLGGVLRWFQGCLGSHVARRRGVPGNSGKRKLDVKPRLLVLKGAGGFVECCTHAQFLIAFWEL